MAIRLLEEIWLAQRGFHRRQPPAADEAARRDLPRDLFETRSGYLLMIRIEDTGQFDHETQSIRWASPAEARQLIQLNRKPHRRRRDLRGLKLALAFSRALESAFNALSRVETREEVLI